MAVASDEKIGLATRIEHTALKADLLVKDVDRLCTEALTNGFGGICIPPYFVSQAARLLEGTKVKVVTVIGFPMGYHATAAKVEEARKAFDQGADEIDMVINIAALKNGKWSVVKDDIQSLLTLSNMNSKVLKVIIEAGMLTESEMVKICEMCNELDVHFVKTSTGMLGIGATPEMVKLMRGLLEKQIRIKASGGIKTRDFAEQLIELGADRIGTSAGVGLLM
ncbi:MAG: deoxyribose-phosphate aldolase [Limisphaerales bacterium]|jgi:deoxyribose-phosphate aldolase